MPIDSAWTIAGSALVTGIGVIVAPLDGGLTVATGVVGVMTGIEQRNKERQRQEEAHQEKDSQIRETEERLKIQKEQTAELQRQNLELEIEKMQAENSALRYRIAILVTTAGFIGGYFYLRNWYNQYLDKEARKTKLAESKRKTAETRALELEDRIYCVVCAENERSVIFNPCKHFACCAECAEDLVACPLCREAILSVEKQTIH